MIFNFTQKYQFSTSLTLKDDNIQIIDRMKLLGTIVTDKLTWDENCSELVRKVNSRMRLIRKCVSLGATRQELVKLWIIYCRSILEQSCVVWHNSLTQENIEDLERCQKTFCKLALQNSNKSYIDSLVILNLDSLSDRRRKLSLSFAKNSICNKTMSDLF